MKRVVKGAVATIIMLGLTACGGGGGSSNQASVLQEELDSLRKGVLSNFIEPSYADLLEKNRALSAAVPVHCDANTGVVAEPLRQAWRAAALSWQRVSWLNFGLQTEGGQLLALQFFPNYRQAVEREVTGFLAAADLDEVGELLNRRPAGQGYPAMEYLLFGGFSAEPKHCGILQLIANNIVVLSEPLASSWQDGGADSSAWLNYSAPYQSDEVLQVLMDAFAKAFEAGADRKLRDPSKNGGDIEALESRWAGQSRAWLAANLAGIEQAFNGADGYGLDDYLQRWLNKPESLSQWQQKLAKIKSENALIGSDFSNLVAAGNTQPIQRLEAAYQDMDNFIQNQFAADFGVTLSFNDLDGD